MDKNFPKGLAICASNPQVEARRFAKRFLSSWLTDRQEIVKFQNSDITSFGIAGRIWEATYVMLYYLDPPSDIEFDPRCSLFTSSGSSNIIVELGAGTGFLGLNVARLLSSKCSEQNSKTLVLTDLLDVCPLLERNRTRDLPVTIPHVNLMIQPLAWGDLSQARSLAETLQDAVHSSHLSHIVCSDLVYFPELLAPLLRTLLQLTCPPFSSESEPVEIIISCMIRSLSKETPFWSAFGAWFHFVPVLFRDKGKSWQRFGESESDTCFIFIAKRKQKTLSWVIPEDDRELLQMDSDAFENLLFMSLPLTI